MKSANHIELSLSPIELFVCISEAPHNILQTVILKELTSHKKKYAHYYHSTIYWVENVFF